MVIPPWLATHRLFGEVLHNEGGLKNRGDNMSRHIFYRVVTSPCATLSIYIWVENHGLLDWPAYCCLYDKYGQIVDPYKDSRFVVALRTYFGHLKAYPGWVNCEFTTLKDLIDFLHLALL